jgi:hypothetical protein
MYGPVYVVPREGVPVIAWQSAWCTRASDGFMACWMLRT